jgi:hypothetical protein
LKLGYPLLICQTIGSDKNIYNVWDGTGDQLMSLNTLKTQLCQYMGRPITFSSLEHAS